MPATVRSAATGDGNGPVVSAPRPPGVTVGDELWAVHFSDNSAEWMEAPTGWLEAGVFDGEMSCRVWRKRVTGTEPTTYPFSQYQYADGTVHLLAVSEASTTIAARVVIKATVGAVATPNVAPASASGVEIRVAGLDPRPGGVAEWTYPAGYTPRGSTWSAVFVASAAASRQVNSSAGAGVKNFVPVSDFSADAPGVGVSINIASAVTVPETEPPPPFTPGRGSALYRYVFRRLLDRSYLGDLDLTGVTFDKRIGQSGAFSATIPIPSRKVANQVAEIIPRDETVLDRGPGVITCEIYRAGVAWGEYWITGATISRSRRGTPAISLRGSTLDAYMAQVEIQEDLPEFIGEDQIEIARYLISHMQDQPGADIGLALQPGMSGVSRDRTYLADASTYGQRLQELAAVDNGFEWTINLVAAAEGLQRQWVWGYPTLGEAEPQHVFVDAPHGGDILEWSEEVDALRGGTRWRASGSSAGSDASTGSTTLYSSVVAATAHLAAGWPRLDRTVQYSDVSELATLDDYAAWWSAKAPGALRVDQYTVALGAAPSLTPNTLGDKARLYIENEWHLRHSRVRRIIGLGITPVSRENGKEEAQLVLEGREDA